MSTDLSPNWGDRLDKVRAQFGLTSEVQLATLIGISPTVLASVRSGRTQLSLKAKLMVMDKLGYDLSRELILDLLPDEARDTVRAIDASRASAGMPTAVPKQHPTSRAKGLR